MSGYHEYKRVEVIRSSETDMTSTTFEGKVSALMTPHDIQLVGEGLAVSSFNDRLSANDKLEFYENILWHIQQVYCDDPAGCAREALKIKDLDTVRD